MLRVFHSLCIAVAAVGLAGCAESAPSPVSAVTAPAGGPRLDTSAQWILSDLQAEFGGSFSLDTTQTGLNAEVRYDAYSSDGAEFCRDHFNPIDLWWDGGDGIAVIHLDPPLLFRGYRSGSYTDRRRLIWRKAIYETVQAGEGTDPAGNVWRFQGRFNALCRGGSRELGPLVRLW